MSNEEMCRIQEVSKTEWEESQNMVRSIKTTLRVLGIISTVAISILAGVVKSAVDKPDKNEKDIISLKAHDNLQSTIQQNLLSIVLKHEGTDSHMSSEDKIATFVTRTENTKDIKSLDDKIEVVRQSQSRIEVKLDRIIEKS